MGFGDLKIGIEFDEYVKWVVLSLDRPSVRMPAHVAREIATHLIAYADRADPEVESESGPVAVHIPFA